MPSSKKPRLSIKEKRQIQQAIMKYRHELEQESIEDAESFFEAIDLTQRSIQQIAGHEDICTEAWLNLDGLPTNWGKVLLSKLDERTRTIWEVFFPGVVEGMTFDAAAALQGVGTGAIQKFPPSVYLGDSGMYIGFYCDQEIGQWSVKIEDADAEYNISLVFLIEAREIGRITLSSHDSWPSIISYEIHNQADRVIFVEERR